MAGLTLDMEKSLVAKAAGGDREAMRQIYDCYSHYLAAVCSRYLVDKSEIKDVLQDSFVRIFGNIRNFECRGEGALKAWMRQIAVNEVLKKLRSGKKKSAVVYSWDLPDTVEEETPDVDAVPMKVIQEMIRALPDGYRTVFNLYVFEEKSHREISKLLGITEGTSASQLHRAKAILAGRIKNYLRKQER